MAELSDLKPASRAFIRRYPFPALGPPPLFRLRKPLSDCRICLVTTAGLHLRSDRAFSPRFIDNDSSFRVIPDHARMEDLEISHTSGDFDRSGINQDLNVVFPVDRLAELSDRHILGSVSAQHFSFMGSLSRTGELRRATAPEVARMALSGGTDIALITPV